MRRRSLVLATGLLAGGAGVAAACTSDYGEGAPPPTSKRDASASPADAGGTIGAAPPPCGNDQPFERLDKLALSSGDQESSPRLTADEKILVFQRRGNDAGEQSDLFMSTRPSLDDAFGAAQALTTVNTPGEEVQPSISADGFELLFTSTRDGDGHAFFRATRPSLVAAFEAPTRVTFATGDGLDAGLDQDAFYASADELWFSRRERIVHSRRLADGTYEAPVEVPELAGSTNRYPVLSPDGLRIWYASTRGGSPVFHVWTAVRTSRDAAFSAPEPASALSSDANDLPAWISRDGCRLYLASTRDGTNDLFVAIRTPVP